MHTGHEEKHFLLGEEIKNPSLTGHTGFIVERHCGVSLVNQIVQGVENCVEQGTLRSGAKLPSVRAMARDLNVSTYTVLEAYDALVARCVLSSRRGAGYFVLPKRSQHTPEDIVISRQPSGIEDAWLRLDMFIQGRNLVAAGCGWLPPAWCADSSFVEALRHATRIPPQHLANYGNPFGYDSLRQHLARSFSEHLYQVEAEQIILTHGVTHAFDLLLRCLILPGDTVFVEEPGYWHLHTLLHSHECRVIPVPRTANGLDVDELNRLAAEYRPKAMFVNTVLSNPLSTTLSSCNAYRLLAAAEQHNFWIIEDDIFRDLGNGSEVSLAALDGLNRVIAVGGFSKSIVPSIRVGYIAAPESLVNALVETKMTYGLTTSEINERTVYRVLANTAHRRYLDRLRGRLDNARGQILEHMENFGMQPLAIPTGGMFVSAGWLDVPTDKLNARRIADVALSEGIALAPGDFFQIGEPSTIWFRFNVAYADDSKLLDFLKNAPARFGLTTL